MLNAFQRLLPRDWALNGTTDRRLLLFRIRQQGVYPALAIPAILIMLLFFVIPLVRMVGVSFGDGEFSVAHYERALTNPIYQRMFRTTFELAITTTIACIIFGYPIAYYLATRTGRWRGLVLLIAIVPFITNSIASTYTWRVVLGRRGPINEFVQLIGVVDEPLELLLDSDGSGNRDDTAVPSVHGAAPVRRDAGNSQEPYRRSGEHGRYASQELLAHLSSL